MIANLYGRIIDYENGNLSFEDSVFLFQELIDSGLAWKLQGHYGRTAHQLIDSGHCTPPPALEEHHHA